jgi:hypothetical protein
MDQPTLCTIDARAVVTARWSELEDALYGYPAAPLLDDCLNALRADRAARARVQWLPERILWFWRAATTRDIEQFPPATPDILLVLRERMVRTRDALARVRALVRELGEDARQVQAFGAPG